MKQQYVKLIFLLILSFILSVSNTIYATSDISTATIEDYDIDMVVNEDNTFDITEKITVTFGESEKGIFREIPLSQYERIEDGNDIKVFKEIDIVDMEYDDIEKNEDDITIQLASSSEAIETHIIKYHYNAGKDVYKESDQLNYSLIRFKEKKGSMYTNIKNVSFRITMPKSFNEENLEFLFPEELGNEDSTISYSVDGNIITGYVKNLTLPCGTGFNVMISLPDGYFIGATENFNIYENIHTYYTPVIISIFIVFTIISAVLCIKYCKNKKSDNSAKLLHSSRLLNKIMIMIVSILIIIRPMCQLASITGNSWIEKFFAFITFMIFPYISFTRSSYIFGNKNNFKQ